MWWLLLTHPLAWAAAWYAPRWWVRFDVRAFAANGARNSLQRTWHRQRATWRAAATTLVALLGSLPAWGNWWVLLGSVLSLIVVSGAYFIYDFNPRLSRARGLPAYYVSSAPGAARFPDRWLYLRATAAVPASAQDSAAVVLQKRKAYAGAELQLLLRAVIQAGIISYWLLLALGGVVHVAAA